MRMRVVGLALPVVIGMTVAVTACGSAATVKSTASATSSGSASGSAVSGSPAASTAASTVASSSPASVPAGYKRVGGAAQGISVAVPSSWVPIDPTKESIESSASKAGLSGISAATAAQDLETLQKLHGILVVDAKYAVDNPQNVAPNISLYCSPSGVNNAGASAVPLLKTDAAAEFEKLGATHITQKDLEIGGVPGVESSYQLSSSTVGTIYGSQLEVLPKPDVACIVTLSIGKGVSAGNILSTAAATAEFP